MPISFACQAGHAPRRGKRAVGANSTLWRPQMSCPSMPLAPSARLGGHAPPAAGTVVAHVTNRTNRTYTAGRAGGTAPPLQHEGEALRGRGGDTDPRAAAM